MELPVFAGTALLLDLDGTLLDLAPTPDAVLVPPGLLQCLLTLGHELQGALAIVTGRPIEQIDALLPGVAPSVAGEHGGVFRHGPAGLAERVPLPELPPDWLSQAHAIVARHPGALLEQKRRGLVLHYRLAPQHGPALHQALLDLAGHDSGFQILHASMAWEIRPRGVDKGFAVATLMQRVPFAGRRPLFLGDDVTDRDGIAVAGQLGGAGLLVEDWFQGPAEVRQWLAEAARLRAWPTLRPSSHLLK